MCAYVFNPQFFPKFNGASKNAFNIREKENEG